MRSSHARPHYSNVSFHQRRLPHWYRDDTPLFVTWCLHGAIPPGMYPPSGKLSAGAAFVWLDRYLDTTRKGPRYLSQDHIAQIVRDSLYKGVELGHYNLYEWVIMPNHIHVLWKPKIHPSRILNSIKGTTAREANRLLLRTGERFWQGEAYDHWVRDDEEFTKISRYIANNPVKAGLTSDPEDFRWSSSYERLDESSRGSLKAAPQERLR